MELSEGISLLHPILTGVHDMLAGVVFGMGVKLLVGLLAVATSVVMSIGQVVVVLSAAERVVVGGGVLSITSVAVSETGVGVGRGLGSGAWAWALWSSGVSVVEDF